MAASSVLTLDADTLAFVSPPPDSLQLKCPICFELLVSSPNLVSCCGNHICGLCIRSLLGKPCPICKTLVFTQLHDKGHERLVNSLKVYCVNKDKGCNWSGEVRELQRHISRELGDCQFEEFSCKHECGSKFFRPTLATHEKDSCHKRPVLCQHCQKHRQTFEQVTNVHHKVCPSYPVVCPNDCGLTLKRSTLDQHMTIECANRKVKCQFADVGCKWFDTERKLGEHLETSWREHMAFATLDSSKKVKEEIALLRKENADLSQRVAKLEELLGQPSKASSMSTKSEQEETKPFPSVVAVSPSASIVSRGNHKIVTSTKGPYKLDLAHRDRKFVSLVVNNWNHKRLHNNLHRTPSFGVGTCSSVFMQVTVHCNGIKSGKGSHISVCANVTLAFSSELFSGNLLITLLSPIPDYESKYGVIIFDETVAECYRRRSPDCVELGIEEFIAIEELDCYLQNDSLHFKIQYFP